MTEPPVWSKRMVLPPRRPPSVFTLTPKPPFGSCTFPPPVSTWATFYSFCPRVFSVLPHLSFLPPLFFFCCRTDSIKCEYPGSPSPLRPFFFLCFWHSQARPTLSPYLSGETVLSVDFLRVCPLFFLLSFASFPIFNAVPLRSKFRHAVLTPHSQRMVFQYDDRPVVLVRVGPNVTYLCLTVQFHLLLPFYTGVSTLFEFSRRNPRYCTF